MSNLLVTPKFRVSYPNLFRSKMNDLSGKSEFSVVALFPFGGKKLTTEEIFDLPIPPKDQRKMEDPWDIIEAVQKAAAAKWGTDRNKWPRLKDGLHVPFRDQGDRAKFVDGKKILPPGYTEGQVYSNIKTEDRPDRQKPQIVDDTGKSYITDSATFYPGCYARAYVSVYAFEAKNKHGVILNAGVSLGLQHVQKLADGEPLGAASVAATEAFAPVAAPAGGSAASIFG